MRLLIELLFILISSSAFAGNDRGSGGGAVVCKDPLGKVTSAELIEYYEAGMYGYTPRFATEADDVVGKVGIILTRLREFDPNRAAQYNDWLSTFFDETEFVAGEDLESTHDFGYVTIGSGCTLEQLAVQEEDGDTRYWINRDVWKLLNNDHRAGLVLHELIYRELRGRGHQNSILARMYGNFITSVTFKDLARAHYDSMLEVYGLRGEASRAPVWKNDDLAVDLCAEQPFSFGLENEVTWRSRQIQIYPLWPGLPKYWDSSVGKFRGLSHWNEDVHIVMIARNGAAASAMTLHLRIRQCGILPYPIYQ